ncbi:glycosyltransferase family 2 protein [Fusobacterium ulcerans]|uniref:glycosyltransferase family 2 protein n=1 Tax=Fusobacterium ulcerans TaxID=861 RepID=UPI001E2E7681|nr:glycosyltransferase [Fusobacterium ulcerans]
MNKIKVSVIIPVYNVEEYIEECLDSVVNQTLKEIEIIIVNDGTQDNSMKKIERFLSDKRMIVINKENGGVSSARNTGMKIAKGEYISFIDPDDFIELTMIEDLYKDAEDADIVFSDFILYDNLNKNEKTEKIYEKKTRNGSMIWSNQLLKFRGVTSKLYKKTFLEENHILFIEKIIYEDTSFNFTAFIISNNVKYIKKFHYYYRQNRDGSTTTSPNKEKEIEAYKKIVMYLERFMSRIENNDFKKTRIYLLMTYYKTLSYKIQNMDISL